MARFTIMDMAKAIGIGTTRDKVTHAGVILKTLSKMGLAPVVGKRNGKTGRPAIVYDLDAKVAKSMGLRTPRFRFEDEPVRVQGSLKYDIWKILEITNGIRVSQGRTELDYDQLNRGLKALRSEYTGRNNPYRHKGMVGTKRVFTNQSAFLIAKKVSAMDFKRHDPWLWVA